ncbi:MAG: triphosphoribosyl-dephospho-CoA synthase [bacterium]
MKLEMEYLAESARNACLMEVLSPKPGNVHQDGEWNFTDLKVDDFVRSAYAIETVFQQIQKLSIGDFILNSIVATRSVTGTNTNLGQVLLMAPIAYSFNNFRELNQKTLLCTLEKMTVQDSVVIFQAIQLAKPGGMGKTNVEDINEIPRLPFQEIMKLAADRDSIAKQYANGFQDIFEFSLPALEKLWIEIENWRDAIVHLHILIMAQLPDSLIARKCGQELAEKSAQIAASVVEFSSDSEEYIHRLKYLDDWLRSDGNRRNPGTTADLVTATIFIALLKRIITIPHEIESLVQ